MTTLASRPSRPRCGTRTLTVLLACGLMAACIVATGHDLEARVPPTPADQRQLDSDPALYGLARTYFPTDDYELAPKRIFRLTRDQIDATIKALLPAYFATSIKSKMARDPLQTNYEYAELLSFNGANLAALQAWIGDIAVRVGKAPSGVIDCEARHNDRSCLEAGARAFVDKAFRGDGDAKAVDKIVAFFLDGVKTAGVPQATADLVEVVLNSPGFLFRRELDTDGGDRLSLPQRLQAISYTMADAPASALGFPSSNAVALLADAESTRSTIGSILTTKAAREKLVRFFRAWLELREPGDFTISTKVFPEFSEPLAKAMLEETDRTLRTELGKPRPLLRSITQATQSVVPRDVAVLYGAKPAASPDTASIALDPTQRLGIFSQPAVIASHSGPTDTRPIKRGVFWVRKIMCMEMGGVPPGLDISLKAIGPTTERNRIQNTTRLPACVGCHKLIDPLGFFQEHYDALGRWRTKDNGFPIDASVAIDFLDEGAVTAKGPVEAIRTLTSSAMFKQCFVRQMFRFYMGRNEEPADDPLLRRMFFAFAGNDAQDILGALETLATSERIIRRR